jgi:hypothetical protein
MDVDAFVDLSILLGIEFLNFEFEVQDPKFSFSVVALGAFRGKGPLNCELEDFVDAE